MQEVQKTDYMIIVQTQCTIKANSMKDWTVSYLSVDDISFPFPTGLLEKSPVLEDGGEEQVLPGLWVFIHGTSSACNSLYSPYTYTGPISYIHTLQFSI